MTKLKWFWSRQYWVKHEWQLPEESRPKKMVSHFLQNSNWFVWNEPLFRAVSQNTQIGLLPDILMFFWFLQYKIIILEKFFSTSLKISSHLVECLLSYENEKFGKHNSTKNMICGWTKDNYKVVKTFINICLYRRLIGMMQTIHVRSVVRQVFS